MERRWFISLSLIIMKDANDKDTNFFKLTYNINNRAIKYQCEFFFFFFEEMLMAITQANDILSLLVVQLKKEWFSIAYVANLRNTVSDYDKKSFTLMKFNILSRSAAVSLHC